MNKTTKIFEQGDQAFISLDTNLIKTIRTQGNEEGADRLQTIIDRHGECSIPVIICSDYHHEFNEGYVISKSLLDKYNIDVKEVVHIGAKTDIQAAFGGVKNTSTLKAAYISFEMLSEEAEYPVVNI